MKLSLSEIRSNAMEFAAEWRDGSSERADAQSFWNDFFRVFGIKRRSVASFEEKVKNLTGSLDRIDVFYSGVMLGEHKSCGDPGGINRLSDEDLVKLAEYLKQGPSAVGFETYPKR